MNLSNAQEGKTYIISQIDTDDEELNAFLFSLGCCSGKTTMMYFVGTLITAPASLNPVAALMGAAAVAVIALVTEGIIRHTNKNLRAEYALDNQ